jgi:lipoyl(octanoyl) transferase
MLPTPPSTPETASPASPPATHYYQIEAPTHPALAGNTVDWGRTQYAEAYARQIDLVTQRIHHEVADTLILTEHHPVFTIGRRRDARQHLVWDTSQLQQQGIEVARNQRGG